MEKPSNVKIGFFEKWNVEAGRIEFSITRVQMVVFTLYTFAFMWKLFILEEAKIDANTLLLITILLAACYSPKLIKDLIDKQK